LRSGPESATTSAKRPRREAAARPTRRQAMQKITPFLWFDTQAGEAARFYVSLFKNSKIGGGAPDRVARRWS
jgi:hypothetical protein